MNTDLFVKINRREENGNVWLETPDTAEADRAVHDLKYEILPSEEAIGEAMFGELQKAVAEKNGDIVMLLLGGRGAQALHKLLGEKAKTNEIDDLLSHLKVFTQDALAPLGMKNSLSFVRDFERLLGDSFFKKVKSFTPMQTDSGDPETVMRRYINDVFKSGGIDIFFIGLGPEAENASHLAYIKPNSGARQNDFAGVIPISSSILEHHISKFKAGGSVIPEADELECRNATHILTVGPAAILSARRIVQSIVDADTAPAKPACYKRLRETEISDDEVTRARQTDENPGLWLRLHPNVRSLVLPNVIG